MIKRNNFFWGLVLLGVGLLLLLDNFGLFALLHVNIWNLIWPLAVIGLGIWILWGSQHATVQFETETLTIPLDGVHAAQVSVHFGAGELRLGGNVAESELLNGTFDGVKHTLSRDEASQVQLRLKTPPIVGIPIGYWPTHTRVWKLDLTPAIPLDLRVHSGASDNTLDLRQLQVTKLRLETGASATHVHLPANAGFTNVRGSSGAASVEFYVPEDVAARIRISGALSSTNVDTARFPRAGNVYQSPDYESAENKVDIHMDIGVGSLNVR